MFRSIVPLVALLTALPAFADLKVGYVDLQRALTEVHEGKSAKEKLKGDAEKKKAEVEGDQKKLLDDKAALDKQASMMSDDVRNQKLAELQKRMFEFTQKAEKMQAELAQSEQKELARIFEKMDPIIASFATRDGLTLMFDKTNSGLVFAPPSLDYTNELVRVFNEKYPKGAGAAGKKDTAKAPSTAPKAEAPKKDAPAAAAK